MATNVNTPRPKMSSPYFKNAVTADQLNHHETLSPMQTFQWQHHHNGHSPRNKQNLQPPRCYFDPQIDDEYAAATYVNHLFHQNKPGYHLPDDAIQAFKNTKSHCLSDRLYNRKAIKNLSEVVDLKTIIKDNIKTVNNATRPLRTTTPSKRNIWLSKGQPMFSLFHPWSSSEIFSGDPQIYALNQHYEQCPRFYDTADKIHSLPAYGGVQHELVKQYYEDPNFWGYSSNSDSGSTCSSESTICASDQSSDDPKSDYGGSVDGEATPESDSGESSSDTVKDEKDADGKPEMVKTRKKMTWTKMHW